MGRGRRPAPAHPIRLMAERRVRLRDGVTVTCRTEGTGLPFVWSHGMLASTALEDALGILDWRALAAERLLVRYDARGHGASSGTGRPADHEWPRLAGDLLQILNDLSLDRVTIGGDSMGVGIGLHLAAAAPERVDALVLAIPPSAWGERVAVARVYGALGALVALDWRALAAERLLVRYDARGHGASSGTGRPADHEWPRLAGDLLQILNDLSLDRVTIGGDSMGVGIGLHLAAAAPERVDALVLAIPPSAWGERVAVARVYGVSGALVASPAGLALKALHLMPVVPVGGFSAQDRGGRRGDRPDAQVGSRGRPAGSQPERPSRANGDSEHRPACSCPGLAGRPGPSSCHGGAPRRPAAQKRTPDRTPARTNPGLDWPGPRVPASNGRLRPGLKLSLPVRTCSRPSFG